MKAIKRQSESRKRGPRYKLEPQQASQVKDTYESGEGTVDDIARKFGVTRQTIYNTIKRLNPEAGK